MKDSNESFRYLTFPDFDNEEDVLKLEAWLCRLWDGKDPAELLLHGGEGLKETP